eukprot:364163-Chlamydomonas_euryale.AAC.1
MQGAPTIDAGMQCRVEITVFYMAKRTSYLPTSDFRHPTRIVLALRGYCNGHDQGRRMHDMGAWHGIAMRMLVLLRLIHTPEGSMPSEAGREKNCTRMRTNMRTSM